MVVVFVDANNSLLDGAKDYFYQTWLYFKLHRSDSRLTSGVVFVKVPWQSNGWISKKFYFSRIAQYCQCYTKILSSSENQLYCVCFCYVRKSTCTYNIYQLEYDTTLMQHPWLNINNYNSKLVDSTVDRELTYQDSLIS